MPFSFISTFFIHNHAPVLENATILKTPTNSTFLRCRLIYPLVHRVIHRLCITWKNFSKILAVSIGQYSDTRVHITYVAFFGKHNLPLKTNTIYPSVNTIYSTIHIIPTTYSILFISILQYCYRYVTYCNYCNQYNTMNIYLVYSYHNYTIIHTILVYFNFLAAYHSYLLSKQ